MIEQHNQSDLWTEAEADDTHTAKSKLPGESLRDVCSSFIKSLHMMKGFCAADSQRMINIPREKTYSSSPVIAKIYL